MGAQVQLLDAQRRIREDGPMVGRNRHGEGSPLSTPEGETEPARPRVEMEGGIIGSEEGGTNVGDTRGRARVSEPPPVPRYQGECDLESTERVGAGDAKGLCLVAHEPAQGLSRCGGLEQGLADRQVSQESEVTEQGNDWSWGGFRELEHERAVGRHGPGEGTQGEGRVLAQSVNGERCRNAAGRGGGTKSRIPWPACEEQTNTPPRPYLASGLRLPGRSLGSGAVGLARDLRVRRELSE